MASEEKFSLTVTELIISVLIVVILIAMGYSFSQKTQGIKATNESNGPVHEESSLWDIYCVNSGPKFSIEEPLIVDGRVKFIDAYTGQTTSAPAAICTVASPTNPKIQWEQPE